MVALVITLIVSMVIVDFLIPFKDLAFLNLLFAVLVGYFWVFRKILETKATKLIAGFIRELKASAFTSNPLSTEAFETVMWFLFFLLILLISSWYTAYLFDDLSYRINLQLAKPFPNIVLQTWTAFGIIWHIARYSKKMTQS